MYVPAKVCVVTTQQLPSTGCLMKRSFVVDLLWGLYLWKIFAVAEATLMTSKIFSSLLPSRSLSSSSSSPHLLILGPPCSGKGTQCELLKSNNHLLHISTGDLLRSSKYSQYHSLMKSGQLLSDDLVTKIVMERVQEKDCQRCGWVLDGFPRTLKQAQLFSKDGPSVDAVLLLRVSDEMVLDRGLNRCLDPVTGVTYHRKYNPPPVEISHRIIERSDDTKETLLYRLKEFKSQADLISRFYEGKVHQIDSMRTADEVNQDIEKILKKIQMRS